MASFCRFQLSRDSKLNLERILRAPALVTAGTSNLQNCTNSSAANVMTDPATDPTAADINILFSCFFQLGVCPL